MLENNKIDEKIDNKVDEITSDNSTITETITENTIIEEANLENEIKQVIEEMKPILEEKEEVVEVETKSPMIKKYLEKPLTRREKKKRKLQTRKYEKNYEKRLFKSEVKSLKFNILLGVLITLGILLVSRYVLKIEMTSIFENLMIPSLFVSGGLVIIALIFLFSDRTMAATTSDPITDFFIVSRGKISSRTKRSHLNRINTRFMMVTFMKLYKKQQIAIVDGRIIYGTMDEHLTDDEVAVLNFLLDHNIKSIDDFIAEITEEHPTRKYGILGKKDDFYSKYKEAILTMAEDKAYINHGINKAKFVLRAGAIAFGLVVIALISKGQGTLEMLGLYAAQGFVLLFFANYIYAHSKGAHQRIAQLRKEKRLLQSTKADYVTALIYNYIFSKEAKVIKRIQKSYETKNMSQAEYRKFSETYNGFTYMLDFIKREAK